MMRYQKENQVIREQLEEDIRRYLASGGKIDVRQPGESKQVDVTNGWAEGFCIDDNVGFGRKVPRNVVRS